MLKLLLLERETFWQLLKDPAHWEMELVVGLAETIVIDLLIGLLIWRKLIKPKWEARIHREHKIHDLEDHNGH